MPPIFDIKQFPRRAIRKIMRVIVFPILAIPLKWFEKKILSEIAFRSSRADYTIDPIIIKNVQYRNTKIKVHIQSFFDYWRIKEYEKHPVNKISEYLSSTEYNGEDIIYYEIGGNIGYSAVMIAKMIQNKGEVLTFELAPTNFKTLTNNIALNQLENITAIPVGLSNQSTIQKFYYNRYHDKASKFSTSGMGMHSINFNSQVHDKIFFYNAILMSTDFVIDEFALPFPTHIFIDAHGAEDEIIQGMEKTLENPKLIVIMVDVEDKKLEESISHRMITTAGFKLVDKITEVGSGVVPTSYKGMYERSKQ